MFTLILASGSPRRKEILEQCKIEYKVIVSEVEEKISSSEPAEAAKELAFQKADDVAGKLETEGEYIVLGADTIVVLEDDILGKPLNEKDAFFMLKRIQNNTHAVYTGVAVMVIRDGKVVQTISFASETKVSVSELTEDEISEYISTGEPMDKAGAYAIQGIFAKYVKKIEGNYNNVVGLPISDIYEMLKSQGINLDKREFCQN
ncbi:Maf family protein [Anaeromicropila populeti]|uniref:dTTP/UTP pyrophosphatase n=1 Tax=Anaeromicropila populeti TaxID=37658 RepID=A0A1I6JMU8_9FIRM|nr:Maf family protein [Anaeromicropila populeti]SFR79890.1 septum formation protein [Anaeromicropila populeti]